MSLDDKFFVNQCECGREFDEIAILKERVCPYCSSKNIRTYECFIKEAVVKAIDAECYKMQFFFKDGHYVDMGQQIMKRLMEEK